MLNVVMMSVVAQILLLLEALALKHDNNRKISLRLFVNTNREYFEKEKKLIFFSRIASTSNFLGR